MLKGFREFIMRGNVVDLAIAVVIGAAFGAVVTALVEDIITPLIAAIFGKPDFSNLAFTINKSTFHYGALINAIVSFLSIAAAIYFLVVLPLNKLAERRAARVAAGSPTRSRSPRTSSCSSRSATCSRTASEPGSRLGRSAPAVTRRDGAGVRARTSRGCVVRRRDPRPSRTVRSPAWWVAGRRPRAADARRGAPSAGRSPLQCASPASWTNCRAALRSA